MQVCPLTTPFATSRRSGFGEHGVHGHAYSLNTPVIGVPLIIFDPRARTRRVIDESVSLRDLPATIMEFARVRDHPFPGLSLAARPAEEGQAFSSVHAEEADWRLRSLISDDYHRLVERDSITALYQPADYPFEQHNLLDTEEGRTIAAKLLPLLRAEASAAREIGSAPTKR